MKNKLAVLALAALSIVGMTGCNRDSNKPTEVIWWNNYQVPDSTMSEEEGRKSSTYREYYYAKDLIEAFEAEHKDIKITTVYKGAYNDIKSQVDSALNGGSLPTMVSCYADSAYPWNEAGAVVDMNDAISELKSDSDFNQKYLTAEKGMYGNGPVLTLPFSKSGETFVYNETLFNKVGAGKAGTDTKDDKGNAVYTAPVAKDTKAKYDVPTNWDEMISLARKMKEDFPEVFANQKDSDGYFTAVPFCWDSTENMIISLLKNANINYTASGDKVSDRVLFNNEEAKKLVVQLKKWNNEGLICTQNQLMLTNAAKGYHAYGSSLFANGKIFMSVSSTAGARYFTNDGYLANMTKTLAWDKGDQKNVKVMSQGPSLCFLGKKGSDAQKAAFTFYKYLTNTENSAKLAVNTSYFPLRSSAANTEEVKKLTTAATTKPTDNAASSEKGKYYSGVVMKLNDTYSTDDSYFLSPVTKESSKCRIAIGGLVNTVFDNKDAKTDEQITAAVEEAFKTAFDSVTK